MRNGKMWPVVAALVVVAGLALYLSKQAETDANTHAVSQATPYQAQSRFTTIQSDRQVMIHCGNSMRLAMEDIAGEFQRRYDIAVIFNFGGGSELLPLIEMGGRGDLFLCHDPYEDLIREKGLLVDSIVIGSLRPIILVPKGNPKGITGLADLGKAGLRLATVDPRYATAGKMVHAVLDSEPWGAAVRENIVIETRGHSDAVLSVLTGHADAAVVWSFLAALYADRLDRVDGGVEFPQEIRVTLCRLKSSTNTEETARLMEFAQSDYAKKVWMDYGYRPTERD